MQCRTAISLLVVPLLLSPAVGCLGQSADTNAGDSTRTIPQVSSGQSAVANDSKSTRTPPPVSLGQSAATNNRENTRTPPPARAERRGAETRTHGTGRLVTPQPESPHFDFIRRTFTDFCYCWDGGEASRAWAASRYDLSMSGNFAQWRQLNPTITTLRYALLISTLDDANNDKPSITGKFLDDMRRWYARHRQYDMERAFLHAVGDGPADSASRLHPHIWSTNRFVGNPTDPGWRAYSIDRLRWVAKDDNVAGVFLDEIDRQSASGAYRKSREFAGADSTVWQNALVSLMAEIRSAIAPKMLQINAAGYSGRDWEKQLGVAAGSVHLETMNRATQELPSVWNLVDWYLEHDVYVDLVGLETWTDLLRPSQLKRYPGGDYAAPVFRGKMVQLASYYMVVPSDPQRLGLQIENVRGFTPDSAGLRAYEYDVGHPRGERRIIMDERDPLHQHARVFRRDFDNAVVLIRPVAYWSDTVMTDPTRVKVAIPDGGPWSRLEPDGTTEPVSEIWLRNSDAVILVHSPDDHP